MKNWVALVFAGASAFSFSFAIDLLLGGFLRVYPSTAFLPVVTWSAIAMLTAVAALRLAPGNRLLVIPFVGVALLAFVGGIVGQRYSLLVGVVILIQAIGVWLATARAKGEGSSKRNDEEQQTMTNPNAVERQVVWLSTAVDL